MSPRDHERPASAPIEASPSKNAMLIDIVRQALDVERDERRHLGGQVDDLRLSLVVLVGKNGEGGLVKEMRDSRKDQGCRIGSLETELGKVRDSLLDLRLRTKLALAAIATAMGAAGAGVAELVGRLF